MDINIKSSDFGFHKSDYRSYLYVLHCKGLFKIGHTKGSVKERVKSMDTGNPFKIDIVMIKGLKSTNGGRLAESELHHRYVGKRRKGEWFGLDWGDIKNIATNGFGDLIEENVMSIAGQTMPRTFIFNFSTADGIENDDFNKLVSMTENGRLITTQSEIAELIYLLSQYHKDCAPIDILDI